MNLGPVITAMVTPFNESLEVDYREAERLAQFLERNGSTAILIGGTTGESPTLSDDEKVDLYKAVRSSVSIPIMVGVGTNSTWKTLKLLERFESLPEKPNAYLVVTPYYNKPPQDALYQHFKEVADNASAPIMLYNIPGRTSREIAVETILELAQHPNVMGLKQALGDLDKLADLMRGLRERGLTNKFLVYSGDDSLTLPMLSLGAVGVVSVASHLVGNELKEMCSSFLKGDLKRAMDIHYKLLPLFRALFITTNPIPVKAALELIGFKVNNLRPPMRRATSSEVGIIRETLEKLGLLKRVS